MRHFVCLVKKFFFFYFFFYNEFNSRRFSGVKIESDHWQSLVLMLKEDKSVIWNVTGKVKVKSQMALQKISLLYFYVILWDRKQRCRKRFLLVGFTKWLNASMFLFQDFLIGSLKCFLNASTIYHLSVNSYVNYNYFTTTFGFSIEQISFLTESLLVLFKLKTVHTVSFAPRLQNCSTSLCQISYGCTAVWNRCPHFY